MRLFKFEVLRFALNKKNKYLMMILSFLVLLMTIFLLAQNPAKQQLKSLIDNVKVNLSLTQENLKKELPKAELSQITQDELSYKKQLDALKRHHLDLYYTERASLDLRMLDSLASDKNSSNQSLNKQQSTQIQKELNYISLVQKRKLHFEIMAGNQRKAFGSLQQLILNPMFFSSIFLLIFAILIAPSISLDFEGGENRFYNFAHISPQANLLMKTFSTTIFCYSWLILILFLEFLTIGFVSGFGSPNYPAFLPNNLNITNGLVDGLSLLYLLLILFFIASLGALLSSLFKKSLVVIGILAVIIVGYPLIENFPFLAKLRRFFPMSYFNPIQLLNNPDYLAGKYSILVGALFLFTMSLIFLFGANLLLKKYRMRRI